MNDKSPVITGLLSFIEYRKNTLNNFLTGMQRFAPKYASLLWFFIGYWILKRGWISIRPPFFSTSPENLPALLPAAYSTV